MMPHDDMMPLIESLMEVATKVSRGDYDDAAKLFEFAKQGKYPPTICQLAEAFGMMMVQVEAREFRLEHIIEELETALARVRLLESIKEQLGKFVPSAVKTLIEVNPENPDLSKRDEDVTVVFLDIAGYTKMSEQVDAEKLNYLIQKYFSLFLDIILENKGDINETAGDGLMIIFQDADPVQHALNGVKAAVAIRHKTAITNESLKGTYSPVIVNIGVNSGTASVGSTRFEGIAGTRWTFTASGPVTNEAARICTLASNGAIIIGHETYRRVMKHFKIKPAGEQKLKNVRKPVEVFEIM